MPRSAVIVVGMHRSGTSAVTRVLNLLGLGLSRDLIGIDHANVTETNTSGFWEAAEINHINDQFLGHFGLGWSSVRPLPPEAFLGEAAERAKERVIDYLVNAFIDERDILLKDPRISRLLPLWTDALLRSGFSPRIVVAVRNPEAVARSLFHRNALDARFSFLLWLRYNLEAETASRGMCRSFISYESMMKDWPSSIQRLLRDCELATPRAIAEAADDIGRFLGDHRRKPRTERDTPRPPRIVDEYHGILNEAAELGEIDVSKAEGMLNRLSEFDELASLFYNSESLIKHPAAARRHSSREKTKMQYLEGRRITLSNSNMVWLVVNGERRYITQSEVYDSLFNDLDLLSVTDDNYLDRGPDLDVGTCLVKSDRGGPIYLVTGSACAGIVKHLITDYETFVAFGFDIELVRVVPHLVIEAVQWGRELRHSPPQQDDSLRSETLVET